MLSLMRSGNGTVEMEEEVVIDLADLILSAMRQSPVVAGELMNEIVDTSMVVSHRTDTTISCNLIYAGAQIWQRFPNDRYIATYVIDFIALLSEIPDCCAVLQRDLIPRIIPLIHSVGMFA